MSLRIGKPNKLIITTLLFAIGVGVFVFVLHGANVFAQGFDIGQALRTAIGTVLESTINLLTRGIGFIMFKMVALLVLVGQYNDFINAPAVTKGWVLARDVMNMFFVIVLLVIAIGTILQKKDLAYQAMLPRLIITAIVINFSKTICGLLIDASQIFMLTFFGAIASASGANFAVLAGIPSIFSKGAAGACGVDALGGAVQDIFTSLFSFIWALVMIVIATIVIGALLIMLVVRIVTLWFLVILSPVAFFFIGLKQIDTQGIGKTWSNEFMKQIFFGPAVGFFLWLSLAVTQDEAYKDSGTSATGGDIRKSSMVGALGPTFKTQLAGVTIQTGVDANCSETSSMGTGGIMSTLIGMGLLIGTLVVAGQTSNKAGNAVSGFAMGVIKGDKMKFTPWAMAKQGVKEQMGRTSEALQSKQNLGLSKVINFARKKAGMQPIETRAGAKYADYEAKKKEEETSISKKAGKFNELTTSEREARANRTAGIPHVKSLEAERDKAQRDSAAARASGGIMGNRKADILDKEVTRLNEEILKARHKDPQAIKEQRDRAIERGDLPEAGRLDVALNEAIADARKTKPQNGQDLATLVEMMLKNKELDATNVNHQEMVNKVLEYRKDDPKGLQAFNDELMKENPRMYLETTLSDLKSTDPEKKQKADEKFVEMEKLGKLDAAKVRGKRTAQETRDALDDTSVSDMEKLKLMQTMAERGELREGDLSKVKGVDELMKTQGMLDQRKAFRENLQKTNSKLHFEVAYNKQVQDTRPGAAPNAMMNIMEKENFEQMLNDYKAGKYDPATLTKEQSDLMDGNADFNTALKDILNVKQREQFLTKAHEANENNVTSTIQTSFKLDIANAPDEKSKHLLIAKLAKMQKSLVMTDAGGMKTLPDTNTIKTLISTGHLKMSDLSKMDLTGVADAEKEKLFRYFATLSEQQLANLSESSEKVATETLQWMRTPRVIDPTQPAVDFTAKLDKYRRGKLAHLNF